MKAIRGTWLTWLRKIAKGAKRVCAPMLVDSSYYSACCVGVPWRGTETIGRTGRVDSSG